MRGQAIAEFAVTLPILFFLIFGVMEGGLLMFSVGTARIAAAEAARQLSEYRLRVDTLNWDGSLPPPDSGGPTGSAHKGYAVRVVDTLGGTSCSGCSLGAWDDMTTYTPISVPGGGSHAVPLFQVPPDYAGQTITLDDDPGDISGGGNVDLYILNPAGAVATPTPPSTVLVYNLGSTRTNPSPTLVNPPLSNPNQAFVDATTAGSSNFNGKWLRLEVPIPNSYAPGSNPANWWWSLQYRTTNNVSAPDAIPALLA